MTLKGGRGHILVPLQQASIGCEYLDDDDVDSASVSLAALTSASCWSWLVTDHSQTTSKVAVSFVLTLFCSLFLIPVVLGGPKTEGPTQAQDAASVPFNVSANV